MIDAILRIDHKLSARLLIPQENKFLRSAAAFFAHSGDSWFWVAGLFIIWLAAKGFWHATAALLAGSIVFQACFVLAIKFLIRRRRPEGEWGEIYRKTDPHSFPSGHAVRACMLAVMVWGLHLYPLCWILTIWAPLVSLARVALGVHYLVDVAAGWLLGILIAVTMLQLYPLFVHLLPFAF
ncbi:MAG: phosphatase PAP2 family protein [Pelolinea sp.]|nr:phosphatase PAP2 family protein [Pelolinea sp.]